MGKQVQDPLQPKSWGKYCRPSDSMALLYVVSSRPVCFHFLQNDIVLLHEYVLQQNSVYFSLSVKSWNYEIVKYHASCAECILLVFLATLLKANEFLYYRLVCLRLHPVFAVLHPTEVFVSFVSINGSEQEIWPASGEQFFEGDLRPNGKFLCPLLIPALPLQS